MRREAQQRAVDRKAEVLSLAETLAEREPNEVPHPDVVAFPGSLGE